MDVRAGRSDWAPPVFVNKMQINIANCILRREDDHLMTAYWSDRTKQPWLPPLISRKAGEFVLYYFYIEMKLTLWNFNIVANIPDNKLNRL